MKTNEKVEIVYKVIVLNEFQKDVAKAYRININTVSRLITKAKKNKAFLSGLLDKDEIQEETRIRMAKIIDGMNKQDLFIDSVACVKSQLHEEHDIETKEWIVKDVMKNELDMSYKKVKAVSVHANS